MITFILLSFLMALNTGRDKDLISSLHGQIDSLEAQKGIKTTVSKMEDTISKIENNIFDLFSNAHIEASDKKKVSTLESELFSRITSLEKGNGKKSQEIIQRLSAQKEILTKIRNSIDQVNNPPTIEKSVLGKNQTNLQLLQSNIIADYKDLSVRIENFGKCLINNKSCKINIHSVNKDNAIHRQLEYNNTIFCHIKKGGEGRTLVPNPHIQSLGITSIDIPFVVQKDIKVSLPDPKKQESNSIVTKKKSWHIDTSQRLDHSSITTPNDSGNNMGGNQQTAPNPGNPNATTHTTGSPVNKQAPRTDETKNDTTDQGNNGSPSPEQQQNPETDNHKISNKNDPVDIEDIDYEEITDGSTEPKPKQLPTGPNHLLLPPHTAEEAIEKIDMTMEQLMQLINLTDMRNHYNQLANRRQTLKKHMQDFDKDGSINADTPLFRSIFPALEHEINEFKKGLTNAIADTQEKIHLIDNSGLTDLDAVKQLTQQVRDIQTAYNTINNDFALVHKDLLDRIYKKTPKQLPPHTSDDGDNTGGETPIDDNNNPAPTHVEDYASISNVTNISRQEAERQAEETMRQHIQTMAWYNPDRIRYFVMRSFIKQTEIDKIINKKQGFHREGDKENAAERHQLQYENNMDELELVELIDDTTYPRTYAQINALVAQYVDTPRFGVTMSKGQLQQKFQAIIMARPPLDNIQPALRDLMKNNNMDQISSNIVYRTQIFKDHQILVNNILKETENARIHNSTDAQFGVVCKKLIKTYISTYNKIPDFMNLPNANLQLDDLQFDTKLRQYAAHQTGLMTIQAQSLRLKVKILNKGRAAHEITSQDHGLITKAGKIRDGDRIANSERLRKHPGLKEALGWVWGGTKMAGTVGIAMGVGAIANPLAAALVMGGTVGLRTLISKFSHYTKEYEGQLRNHAIDSTNYNAERNRLHDMVDNGELQRWHKYLPTKKGHERRHRERYINTTQSSIVLSKDIAATIKHYTDNPNPLTQPEKDQLMIATADALARLNYYRDVGQNFTGTDLVTKAEEDYHSLYQTVLGGAQRLGMDLTQLEQDPNYTLTRDVLEQQYTQTFSNFKAKRRKLGWHRAIARGVLTGGLTYASKAAQSLFTSTKINTTNINTSAEEWQLGKHGNLETMSGAAIDAGLTPISNPALVPPGTNLLTTINIGTDATAVSAAKMATYTADIATYNTAISGITGLSPATAAEVASITGGGHPAIATINTTRAGDPGNRALAVSRFLRGALENLEEVAANTNAGTIDVTFNTTSSTPGVMINNAAERFFDVKSYIVTEETKQLRGGYGIPANIADNTFKRREGNVGTGYMTNNPNNPQRRPNNPTTPTPPTPNNP